MAHTKKQRIDCCMLLLATWACCTLVGCQAFVVPYRNHVVVAKPRTGYFFFSKNVGGVSPPPPPSVFAAAASFKTTTTTSLSASSASSSLSSPQLLQFQEPTTNVTVILVGSMHYNPTSMKLVRDTIEAQETKKPQEPNKNNIVDGPQQQQTTTTTRLKSVVIESCLVRYNDTTVLTKRFPVLKTWLQSEMSVATELSLSYNRPVVLGDQLINVTTQRLGQTFRQCLRQLFLSPSELLSQIQESYQQAVPQQQQDDDDDKDKDTAADYYLGPNALLDPPLLLATPVSLIKYPLSYFAKSPGVAAILTTLLVLLQRAASDEAAATADLVTPEFLLDWIVSLGFSALEIVVFSRLLLGPLLAERNLVLAKNILRQCQIYSSTTTTTSTSSSSLPTNEEDENDPIVYVPTSIKDNNNNNNNIDHNHNVEDNKDAVVVAVVGMAHCNGIKKVLMTGIESNAV